MTPEVSRELATYTDTATWQRIVRTGGRAAIDEFLEAANVVLSLDDLPLVWKPILSDMREDFRLKRSLSVEETLALVKK